MMKAVPLPSPEVMLSSGYKRYYGHLRLPLRPDETSLPYIHQLPICILKGLPCYPAWLSLRVTPATPEVRPLSLLIVVHNRRISLPLTSRGSAASLIITRLRKGSLSLQPAGLLDSLNEPLSGNLMLRVTPHTSLKLHGRMSQFP